MYIITYPLWHVTSMVTFKVQCIMHIKELMKSTDECSFQMVKPHYFVAHHSILTYLWYYLKVTIMVSLRGNIALACKNFSSKQHRLIEFCVLICSQGTRSCKVISTQNKPECTILHVHKYVLYVIVLVVDASRRVSYSTRQV